MNETNEMDEKFFVEISESEAWVVEIALMKYHKNPINEEHEKLSLEVYERIKKIVLKRSTERFIASR